MALENAHPLFETPRLWVRPITPDDLDAMVCVYGDAEAMRFVGNGLPIEREACQRWIDVTQSNYATRGYGMWAITSRSDAVTVGFCGFVHPGGQETPEIKYALAHAYWGQGFATEAVAALLHHGVTALGLDPIIATVHAEHVASQRVLTKVGMVHTQTLPQEDGTFTKVFAYSSAERAEACSENPFGT